MRREWRHATALDADLVEALSKASRQCEMAWRAARPKADFAAVLTPLGALLALVREAAEAKSEVLGLSPYEALLDEFDPGCSLNRIEAIFDDYRGLPAGLSGAGA